MEEINLNYFVPENLEELKGLVGKVVGVRVTSINDSEPMIYFGISDEYHEFLSQNKRIDRYQRSSRVTFLNEVYSWNIISDDLLFNSRSIIFNGDRHRTIYTINDNQEFEKRFLLLKQNNLWR